MPDRLARHAKREAETKNSMPIFPVHVLCSLLRWPSLGGTASHLGGHMDTEVVGANVRSGLVKSDAPPCLTLTLPEVTLFP
ncbi:hypothetical protein CCMA1212_005042 [Trichoderma ghanense]|uniref:Uncharacterized protein n=1 Tax=Trichoderma ghanense TaxID=65468 RepID=A0ABY2H454_9HYPO